MDQSRVVRLRTPSEGGGAPYRFGSGYLIGPELILTAAHVLTPPGGVGGGGDACQVLPWRVNDDDEVWIDGSVLARDSDIDVAVVSAPGVGDDIAAARWGRIEGSHPVRWVSTGFPVAGLGPRGRQPEQAWGQVSPVTQAFEARLGLVVESRDAREAAVGSSGWAGLSGAAVFAYERLVGVVVEDPEGFSGSLTAVRAELLAERAELFRAVGSPEFEAVVTPADAAVERRRLTLNSLLAALRNQSEEFPYLTIRRAIRSGRVPPLSEVYVEQFPQKQAATASEDADGADRSRREGSVRSGRRASRPGTALAPATATRETVMQALTHQRHLVIEGGPGIGKSTLLHRLVSSLLDPIDPIDPPRALEGLVPIRASAPQLASAPGSFAARLRGAVLVELGAGLRRHLPEDLFEDPPEAGKTWLVIVDGLDAILDGAARDELVHRLAAHAADASAPYRFVVASRPVPELARLDGTLFGRYRLLPFDTEQVRSFAASWFEARPDAAGADADSFLAQVEESRIADLTRTPLLLNMAVIVYEQATEAGLPSTRALLYASFVRILLDDERAAAESREALRAAWRKEFGGEGEAAADRVFGQRRRLLEDVAMWQQEGNDGSVTDRAAEWLRPLVPDWVDARWRMEQTDALLTRTGLLTPRDGSLSFLHDTFREYLAASAIVRNTAPDANSAKRMFTRWRSDRWREVALFSIGLWSAPSEDRHDHDLTAFLMEIWQRSQGTKADRSKARLLFVASALAEGPRVTQQFRRDVVEGLAALARSRYRTLWELGLRPDDEAVRLLTRLHARDQLSDISQDQWNTTVEARAAAALGIGILGDGETATALLVGMLESSWESVVAPARALFALGQSEVAVGILLRKAADTSARPAVRIEAIQTLVDAGHMEAVPMLLEVAQRTTDSTEAGQTLARLGHADDAARAFAAVADNPGSLPFVRQMAVRELGALGRIDDVIELATRVPARDFERRWLRTGAREGLRSFAASPSTSPADRAAVTQALATFRGVGVGRTSGGEALLFATRLVLFTVFGLGTTWVVAASIDWLADRQAWLARPTTMLLPIALSTLAWSLVYMGAAYEADGVESTAMAGTVRAPIMAYEEALGWPGRLTGWPLNIVITWGGAALVGTVGVALGAPANATFLVALAVLTVICSVGALLAVA